MDYSVVITGIAEGTTSFTLSDRSPWSLGSNPDRDQRALVLFVTRTDKNGVRTLLDNTPDTVDALTCSSWEISIGDDGWIEKILFSVRLWNSGQAYAVGDIIYNVSNQSFYKCILANTNQQPPNATYWTVQTGVGNQNPSDLYDNEINNASTQMEVEIMNDLFTGLIESAIEQEYERGADGLDNGTQRAKGYNQADDLSSQLAGAYSALDNDRPSEAEEQVRSITNYTVSYGTP